MEVKEQGKEAGGSDFRARNKRVSATRVNQADPDTGSRRHPESTSHPDPFSSDHRRGNGAILIFSPTVYFYLKKSVKQNQRFWIAAKNRPKQPVVEPPGSNNNLS